MLLDTMSVTALIANGLIEGIPAEEYHSAPGVSKTGLDHFSRSPAHFQAYLNEDRAETPALRFGRIFHRFILEPDLCRLAVWDGPARNTKAGKEAWGEFQERNAGAEIVSAEERDALEGMRASVYAHPMAKAYLMAPGRCELSKWAYDQESGELCKVRPDKLLDAGLSFDLKSAKDASPRGFAKACAERRYHVQAAFYPDVLGLDDKRMPFIAVEKEPPYACAVYMLDDDAVSVGRRLYRRDLARLAECKISKSWPAYSEGIEQISLPAWATKGEIE
ncbi:MAG: PD-(D/E)XK nuclease-like domain-containing protein [Thermodesulfobacteriota bacterium]